MEREIITRGHGEVSAMPDRARLDVAVEAEGSSRDRAYRDAAHLAQDVDVVLAARSDAVEAVVTASLAVHPTRRVRRGESVRSGWRATRRTTLEVTDFAQLGELIAELTGAGAAVAGPAWSLDRANPAHAEARRRAAADARQRAEDYAAALGLTLGAVAWVAEPGLRAGGGYGGPVAMAASAVAQSRRGSDEPPDVIEVTPEPISTGATVEVGFSL